MSNDYEYPETITLLHDSDDAEGSLFSYIHDAILLWDDENNGRDLSDAGLVLPIASAVWDELLTRRVKTCIWRIDDGDGEHEEVRPHDFTGDGRTCVNCLAPEPDDSGRKDDR